MSSEVEASIDAHLEMVGRRANAAYKVIKAAAEEATAIERARIVAALRVHAQQLDDAQESDPYEVHGVIKAAQLLEDNVL